MKTLSRPKVIGARDRLIEAAGEIFSEAGYHGATVREITHRAGVNLSAINYYFRDKEELYWEVLQHALNCALRLDPLPTEEQPPEEQLRVFISEFLRYLLDPARPDWHGKLMAREMGAPTRLLDVLVESNIRPKRDVLRQILRQLVAGKIFEEQEAMLCGSIMGQCLYYRQNRAVIERLYPEHFQGDLPISQIARHITEFSLAALAHLKPSARNTSKRKTS